MAPFFRERKKPINIKNFGGTPPGVRPVCPGDTSHLSRDMSRLSQVSLGRPEFVPGTPPGHPDRQIRLCDFSLSVFFSPYLSLREARLHETLVIFPSEMLQGCRAAPPLPKKTLSHPSRHPLPEVSRVDFQATMDRATPCLVAFHPRPQIASDLGRNVTRNFNPHRNRNQFPSGNKILAYGRRFKSQPASTRAI